MRVRTLSALFVVVAILFIFAVGSKVFVDGFMEPQTLFGYLVFSTLTTGVLASVVVESINSRITARHAA